MNELDSLIESTRRLKAANDMLEIGNTRREHTLERSQSTCAHALEMSTRAEARTERTKALVSSR